ncbi:hypothetical protein K493DRAFT_314566 [Basidiobolus meristosporus CBS 931.73]|uniref:HTH araC/xylS-type domain-containing protein n=1 Tax=Basidiobolus meristosporus CBS 931.73 TaxID=1314790 RepID=A0A1Y1YE42_9FUNG|nr:hypothetical protein K493DRAFT_314566 [Basidiobolus meristosporus CBS 931.73]|eukprot:ORX96321.1 hypothetical protein K493DRAFT_314566 [Basidiobolus meristosporus CBS 931.73]
MNQSNYRTDDQRWRALTRRDPLAEQEFVYCVKTTKIFCRPTCPSRLARRANVVYYDHSFEARQAGYRPCKRCRPEIAKSQPTVDVIALACRALAKPENSRVSVSALAEDAGLSITQFRRLFKKRVGVTPTQYARDRLDLLAAEKASLEKAPMDIYELISTLFTPEELQLIPVSAWGI